jgi:hypothetical protein
VWPEQATPGQVVTLDAEILDPAFEPLADARAELVITTPLGDIDRQPLTPTVQGRGFYRARFAVAETGRYDLELRLEASDRTIINEPAFVNVTADGREFHQSDLNRDLLTWIAELTGGRYFPVADARQLPDVIDDLLEQRIFEQRIPLWDAPLLLLALLLLLSLEWLYRRRLRLP